uniref:ERVV2 protein n=1 Tax=Sander lucioperca TaxID=283035 RepID=A0A8C9YTN4_SANLU
IFRYRSPILTLIVPAIEVIANETGKALMLLSSELASVRLVALQNRAALDFLLAARGGTCAVIGAECCTFVPDNNATIGDIINHLHDTNLGHKQERERRGTISQ